MSQLAIDPEIAQFDDMQISVAAQMVAGGYDVSGVEAACGLDNGEFALLRQDPRYKALATEATQERASEELQADTNWDSLEAKALATLSYDVANHSAEMTVGEKLAVAAQANRARRRAGRLAEGNKNGNMNGTINGDINNGTVINLHLPQVITDRLKNIEQTGGEIYEHEKKDKFDPTKHGGRLTVDDVQRVFQVDVTNPDRAFADDDDARLFDEIIAKGADEEVNGLEAITKGPLGSLFAQAEG